ncbi:MAG: sulfur carrier protein ThiS [Planctomycetales bacterium]|nr:sulfur carrier protein ThiS [Planctomycetales bacterium]
MMITIQFNGQPLDVPPETSLSELLALAEIRSQVVAVEVNREIVPRSEHGQYQVAAGDVIEAVTLVGGG